MAFSACCFSNEADVTYQYSDDEKVYNPESLVDICIPVICSLVNKKKLDLMAMEIPESLREKIKDYYMI